MLYGRLQVVLRFYLKIKLFLLCQVHDMPSSILQAYLHHEHIMLVDGALSPDF